MNRKNLNGVTAFLLGLGLWTMTGLGVAAEKVCVPSPARPCPAISATPLSKDRAKPLLSPVTVVPVKTSAPLRAELIWTPKTVLIPPFTGEGYRFEPKTVNVPTFTGDGYRFQPKTVTASMPSTHQSLPADAKEFRVGTNPTDMYTLRTGSPVFGGALIARGTF